MRLVITDDYDKMSEWAARYIKKRINSFQPGPNRMFVLGLPTGKLLNLRNFRSLSSEFVGSTPVGMYKKLIEFVNNKELSFKYVITFNMDEYVGLPEV